MADRRLNKTPRVPRAAQEIPDPAHADCMHGHNYEMRESSFEGTSHKGMSVTPKNPRHAP